MDGSTQRMVDRLASLILDLNGARDAFRRHMEGDLLVSPQGVAAQVVAVSENLKPVRNELREWAAADLLAHLEKVENSPVSTASVASMHG